MSTPFVGWVRSLRRNPPSEPRAPTVADAATVGFAAHGASHPPYKKALFQSGLAPILGLLLLCTALSPLAQTTEPTLDALHQRITEVRTLLDRMAELETTLEAAAERAGQQADSAYDPHQMQRYETLYQETRLRIRELQDQQRELRELLGRLEATLARLADDAP